MGSTSSSGHLIARLVWRCAELAAKVIPATPRRQADAVAILGAAIFTLGVPLYRDLSTVEQAMILAGGAVIGAMYLSERRNHRAARGRSGGATAIDALTEKLLSTWEQVIAICVVLAAASAPSGTAPASMLGSALVGAAGVLLYSDREGGTTVWSRLRELLRPAQLATVPV